MVLKGRQGTAEPRWGWTGVAPLTSAQFSGTGINLEALLPGHRSSSEQILVSLGDLAGRYHRYLHQDELGPSRAERMAALRLLLDRLTSLLSGLSALPEHLGLQLAKQLRGGPSFVGHDLDIYQAYRNDEEAVQQVGEAAIDVGRILQNASAVHDAELMNGLSDAAERAIQLLQALDTTTAGAVVIDSELPRLEVNGGAESDMIELVVARSRIERLRSRAALVLAGLQRRRGPERCESLRWFVWQLCDLYHRETGRRVTSNAVIEYSYEGIAQSSAGKFVRAAVEALHPSEAWAQEPDHRVAQRRARLFPTARLQQAIHYAMREYVAQHPRSRVRRGPPSMGE
jgi:hypothetical protein